MKNRLGSSIVKLIVLGLFVGALAWVALNRQAVIDQVRLLSYTPSTGIKQLADSARLQPHARNLFYVSDPQILESGAFNEACSSHEQTIVLGCYKAQRIYLYDVTDPRFSGVKEVTAAHEMLHAAYERLSKTERERVDEMLRPIIEGMADPRILELIVLYNKTEPGELYNEMHAILGTEYASLTPELEEYYRKYFQDRTVVVGFASQYQAVFTESKRKIDEYDRQLGTLKPQIDQNNATLELMQGELEAQAAQLNSYRSSGQIQQYNQLVPGYNTKVNQFNSLIEQTRGLVNQYNAIVDARNQQVAAQADLYDSINSNYRPTSQQ